MTFHRKFELDSMFQELDTPPSRWRCGCSIAGIGLITADIDQAFEACSAIRRCCQRGDTSPTLMSPGSRQILCWFKRGRRQLCKPGSSQSFGRGWVSFSAPVLARALFCGRFGYSNWWGHELCCGCGSVGMLGSAAEASSVGFPVSGTSCS